MEDLLMLKNNFDFTQKEIYYGDKWIGFLDLGDMRDAYCDRKFRVFTQPDHVSKTFDSYENAVDYVTKWVSTHMNK